MALGADATRRRLSQTASSWVDRHFRWLLVSPAVVLILALTIFPLGYAIWVAFVTYDFNIPGHAWRGIDNFKEVVTDPNARKAIATTAWLATAAVAIELVIGLLLALAMVRPFRGRRWLIPIFLLPLFMSPVIVGQFWALLLTEPFGPTNWLLGAISGSDVNIRWTTQTPWAYFSILLADAWQWTPFMFVILLAGLSAIPDDLYSAADLDGARPRQAFFFVTLPLLLPVMLVAVAFRVIDAAKIFDVIYVLTKGGPGTDTYTASYYLYEQGFQLFHLGRGTAGAWMFMILLSVVSYWLVRRLLKPVEA
ncbi:MAG: sugar ABC transporter permease [Thermoleophilia bacterium]|nr:sugar ABC transporter permease [Thermoleophilia bacterium]